MVSFLLRFPSYLHMSKERSECKIYSKFPHNRISLRYSPNICCKLCCANSTLCENSQHLSNLSKQTPQTLCGSVFSMFSIVHRQQACNFRSIECSTSVIDATISLESFSFAHNRQYSVISFMKSVE